MQKDGDTLCFVFLDSSLAVPERAELQVACSPSDVYLIVQLKDQSHLEG